MDNLDKTMLFRPSLVCSENYLVTIFDANHLPQVVDLAKCHKTSLTFGRGKDNDIVLDSPLVSRKHGRFVLEEGQWKIEDLDSTNGLIYNNEGIRSKTIGDGDLIRIDDNQESMEEGVLFVCSSEGTENKWTTFPLEDREEITIGRATTNKIVLPHISVSEHHVTVFKESGHYYLKDNGSMNGVLVNNKRVTAKTRLQEKDVIIITNSKLIFTSAAIFYCCFKSGISVDASDVVIKRGRGRKSFVTCNHVNLNIRPGELVAIIGGSGAGKSTILNSLCGYLEPAEGDVYINGVSLYKNFDSLKKLIGYVPQSDIVYDNLTLYDMLNYTSKLRLQEDVSDKERQDAIHKAIEMVELTEKKNSLIKALSGGQRKRASIAVELLSDPNLLFLDEPASGLDPGTERNLMHSLREMADGGKTVVLVTHSTLQLQLCDKIVFMGKGGNLCFYGSYEEALEFFEVSDIVDVYNMITDNALDWKEKYAKKAPEQGKKRESTPSSGHAKENKVKQLLVLCGRYLKLIFNDRQRLMLLLIQAPLLALLISFVADDQQFEQYEMTKSLLFALSCSAFWIGMLNAIQEICKERTILKREYMTGLSLSSYIASKIIVLGGVCLIQSVLVTGVFNCLVGTPSEGVLMTPYLEILVTTFITAVASTAMGLLVSSLFSNADRAMTVAPILLMPQILFSGLIFKLDGITECISWFAVCRWSMEGYGTTANLNGLPLKLQQQGVMIPHEAEDFFEYSTGHLLYSWAILILFTIVFLALARLVIGRIGKESA